MRMSQGAERIVSTPGLVPPGTIPQAQQAQHGTPLSFSGAAGHFGPPPQQQTPQPSQNPLPPSAPHPMQEGPPSVHSQHQSQHGTPARPVGVPEQFVPPLQQPPPQVASPNAPPSMHGGPPSVPPPQQGPHGMPMPMGARHPSGLSQHPPSVHGGSPVAPLAATSSAPGLPPLNQVNQITPFPDNDQAAGANAQRPDVMFDNENSSREMENLQEEMFNMRMRDAKAATAKDPKAQVSWEDVKSDMKQAQCDSLLAHEEALLKQWAEDRARARGGFDPNGGQGGGSRGGATPWAKRCFLANFTKSKKDSVSNDSPTQPRATPTIPEHEGTPKPSASNMPDEDEGGVALGKQPETRDVNLERSKSPNRSPSRAQRHHRRREPVLNGRRRSAGESGSSRPRGGTERWRRAGMYYTSGENQGGAPVRYRSKRWDTRSGHGGLTDDDRTR